MYTYDWDCVTSCVTAIFGVPSEQQSSRNEACDHEETVDIGLGIYLRREGSLDFTLPKMIFQLIVCCKNL